MKNTAEDVSLVMDVLDEIVTKHHYELVQNRNVTPEVRWRDGWGDGSDLKNKVSLYISVDKPTRKQTEERVAGIIRRLREGSGL